jgi:indole-3-glycerol phosphate synthase
VNSYDERLTPLPDILARIVARKREELRLPTAQSLAELRDAAEARMSDRRNFRAALKSRRPAIISEIKKASPSKGVLIEDFRPEQLARQYERGGAAALSVLTDRDFFCGSLADLAAARAACNLPVLRKDFTIAEYHVVEAAAAGADAILLIVAILDDVQLRAYRELAREFAMDALVEVHDAAELDRAVASGAEIIGVNNRDLRTFSVSLETSVSLAPRLPASVVKVSESGIFGAADVRWLRKAGFDAFLVGEHLVKSPDAAQAIGELVA